MSTPIIPVVTIAGIQAALDAQANGLQLQITQLALGSDGYVPSGAETALSNEEQRVSIAAPGAQAPGQLHVAALVSGAAEYWINELGFFDADGVLFAVWSNPLTPIGYKAAAVDLIVALDLAINSVDPGAVTVITTNNDPTLVFLAEQGAQNARLNALDAEQLAQNSRLDDLAAAPSGGGGTDPADQDRITTLETSQNAQDTAIAALVTEDTNLSGRLDDLEGASPGGGTDPADQARITSLETSQGTQDVRLDALEVSTVGLDDIAVSPNRLYATQRLQPFCGGALNTPLAHDAGGVTAPYTAAFRSNGSAGTATIEVVSVQDTARLTALGIPRAGAFLGLSANALAVEFNIAVIDMGATSVPAPGAYFHLGFAAQGSLNSAAPQFGGSNEYIGATNLEVGAWVYAMQIDTNFNVKLGSAFSGAVVGEADVATGWQYVHAVVALNPNPGLFFGITGVGPTPASGTTKIAIALPYLGFGNHGGASVWDMSIKDVIDGL